MTFQPPPPSSSAEIAVDQVKRFSRTQDFDVPEFVVTRRDTSFPLTLRTRSRLAVHSVTLDYEEGKRIGLIVQGTVTRVYATIINVSILIKALSLLLLLLLLHVWSCNFAPVMLAVQLYSVY